MTSIHIQGDTEPTDHVQIVGETNPLIKKQSTKRAKITPDDVQNPKPIYAVWEITLRCDHACSHCGSRAELARPDELSTKELIDVADQLIRIGTREVTLIGGEAYLRSDVYDVVPILSLFARFSLLSTL